MALTNAQLQAQVTALKTQLAGNQTVTNKAVSQGGTASNTSANHGAGATDWAIGGPFNTYQSGTAGSGTKTGFAIDGAPTQHDHMGAPHTHDMNHYHNENADLVAKFNNLQTTVTQMYNALHTAGLI